MTSAAPQAIQFAILGNPDNRRVSMFQDALARLGLPQARELAYRDLLDGRLDLGAELAFLAAEKSILRIESPGGDFAVTRALLALGARHWSDGDPAITAAQAEALSYQRGLILAPAQLFVGYAHVLAQVRRALADHPRVAVMNAPEPIGVLFDKAVCRQRLGAAGVRMAADLGEITGYEQLRAALGERGVTGAFVKLCHGSSASGVVAYRSPDSPQGESAVTSTVIRRRTAAGRVQLFNSLRLRRYQRPRDIRTLIDRLAAERVVVEAWVEKVRVDGQRCDARIVVIAGRARHAVVRCSDSPMTNLHLGNRRADVAELVSVIGEESWRAGLRLAEKAVAQVPGLLYAGADVMFDRASLRPHIVELNAFGDLLPGLTDAGDDTYAAEIRAQLALMDATRERS